MSTTERRAKDRHLNRGGPALAGPRQLPASIYSGRPPPFDPKSLQSRPAEPSLVRRRWRTEGRGGPAHRSLRFMPDPDAEEPPLSVSFTSFASGPEGPYKL